MPAGWTRNDNADCPSGSVSCGRARHLGYEPDAAGQADPNPRGCGAAPAHAVGRLPERVPEGGVRAVGRIRWCPRIA